MKSRTALVFLFLFLILCFGTFGYSQIEGWSLADSLYMTIITITTTGYAEVHPLTEMGRVFTVLILGLGFGTVAYAANAVVQDILSIDLLTRRRLKMEKKIAELSGHTVVCGYGRMGKVVCKELQQAGIEFVVIDKFEENFANNDCRKLRHLIGDATQDSLLLKAGIDRAKTLVCMIDSDADSLYVSLAGRSLNPDLYIVSRANEEAARLKILRAGADRVILPLLVSGIKVAQTVLDPEFDDLLDIAGVKLSDKERIQLKELPINESTNLIGKSLANSGLRREQLLVVGVRHKDGEFTFSPPTDYAFKDGDTLITLGTHDSFIDAEKSYAA